MNLIRYNLIPTKSFQLCVIVVGHINQSCGKDWEYGNFYCYHFSYDVLNWFKSKARCEDMNAKLMTLESAEENVINFIFKL